MPDPVARLSYALSPSQTRSFLEDALPAAKLGLNIEQIVCSTTEDFDSSAFLEAWRVVVNRHAALGVGFKRDTQQRPYQWTSPPVEVPSFIEKRTEVTAPAREAFLEAWLGQDRKNIFELSDAPPMRFGIFCFADDSVTWVWSFHQILMDSRSIVLVLEDFFECYAALRAHRPVVFPERAPFSEFVAWQQDWMDMHDGANRTFWKQLITSDEIDAHFSLKRTPPAPDYRQARLSFDLDAATEAGLRRLEAEYELSLKISVQGAWALVLSRYYRSKSVTFGTVRECRHGSVDGTESMIGVLMNFLPLHADLSDNLPAVDFLKRLREQQLAVRPHQWTSLDTIRASIPAAASKQLFDSCVLYEHRRPAQEMADRFGQDGARRFSRRETSNIPLLLSVSEKPQFQFDLIYQSALFEPKEIEQLGRAFRAVLRNISRTPQAEVGTLELLAPDEKSNLTRSLSGPSLDFAKDKGLHEWFEEQVRRTPQATAIMAECDLTYEQLDRRAAGLAVRLGELDVQPDQLVAVFLPRSSALLIAILGVLKSGAAYLPVDVELPKARLKGLLDEARVAAIITEEMLADSLPAMTAPILRINSQEEGPTPLSVESRRPVRGHQLAYAISTSGTTGRPKLIGVEHAQVSNLLTFATEQLLQSADVRCVPFIDSPSFDSSISQIFTTLALGGTLVRIPNISAVRDSPFFQKFTCLGTTPSLLGAILKTMGLPPAVRFIGLGAEAIPPDLLEKLDHLPQIRKVINYYGPTETTVYCTCSVVLDRADPNLVVDLRNRGRIIGRPIANTRVYIVDDFGQIAPLGAPGELCIAGDGVARGYLNAAGEAARNFLPDSFASGGHTRMYRSGDIVCLKPDGQLEFHGRRDHQLKFNGVRIEAAEIENALEDLPGVHQALVDVRSDVEGAKRLVAYLAADSEKISRQDLKRALRLRLPDSMIPHHFLFLASLPLNSNGKVDRDALSRLEIGTSSSRETEAPLTTMEKQMIAVWEQNLSRKPLGLAHDYFELGGDSLSAVNLLAAIERQFGLRLKPALLLDNSTLSDFLRAIQSVEAAAGPQEFVPTCSFVTLREAGDDVPVVIIPGGSGTVLINYKNFAQKLPAGHPVYSLQYPFALTMERRANPVAHLSHHVADKLLELVGDRPFVLFGHCMGGILAWHVAGALKERNAPAFELVLYDAPAAQQGVNKTENLDELVQLSRLQLTIKAYRPAWEDWRMDHGASWWSTVTFFYWMWTNFLMRRGWMRSKEDPLRFVKLSYLRLLEGSPLNIYPDEALLIYHHAQEPVVTKSLWPSLCPDLRLEFIPGSHRVWQTAIVAILPFIRDRLSAVDREEASVG